MKNIEKYKNVKVTKKFTNKGELESISIETDAEEFFEIIDNDVVACYSNDIGLNSNPDVTRVGNHIHNVYGVDVNI